MLHKWCWSSLAVTTIQSSAKLFAGVTAEMLLFHRKVKWLSSLSAQATACLPWKKLSPPDTLPFTSEQLSRLLGGSLLSLITAIPMRKGSKKLFGSILNQKLCFYASS